MGLIQKGQWRDKWYDTEANNGNFKRQESVFRGTIVAPSEANAATKFVAEKDRYHLYVSLACPWAHRTLIFRELKQLRDYIGVTVVDYLMLENGWTMNDPLNGHDYLYQLYLQADEHYEGRVTVPVLWDKKLNTIVNNESSDIIRMFNSAFNELTGDETDYYPESLREDIDEVNERIYHAVNNGVYKAGFATTQTAYETHVFEIFEALDELDTRLANQRYLIGDVITEADWRLFTTLIRFDSVYVGHFKCNLKTIESYPHLSGYLRELYQVSGIASTVDFEHIKGHYYESHLMINPTGVVPAGPYIDYSTPHGRG